MVYCCSVQRDISATPRKKIDVGLIVALLLALFIIQPLLQPGLPVAADYAIHLYRTMEFEQAWSFGLIIPRWAPNLAYGYGYPLFVFAPPLPYLLGLIFYTAGASFETALKLVVILAIFLYAGGMYLLGRDLLGSVAAGLVAAVAYAFAPFALREALLYGGNVPQFLAIGLFPWCLWAMTRTTQTQSWLWAGLSALLYAAIVLSHLFHALIFTPVAAAYGLCLVLIKILMTDRSPVKLDLAPRRLISQIGPLLTIPLGLLLSAFSWLPAFIERTYTRAQTEIYLVKSPFFVRFPHWSELLAWLQPLDERAANPYVPLSLGVITVGLAGVGFCLALGWAITSAKEEVRLPTVDSDLRPRAVAFLLLFFGLVAGAAIFMALSISRPIWELVEILQVAEFPWRMLGLANLGLAVLAGAAIKFVPLKLRWPVTTLCLVLQLTAVAPLLYPATAFIQYGQLSIADQIDYERRSQSIGTTTLGEYLPQTVSKPPTTSPLVPAFLAGEYPARLDFSSLPLGVTANLLIQSAVTHRYEINSPAPFTLRFFQFAYPGWRAQLDDQPLAIRPEAESGLILLDVPAGRHTITLHFGETPNRVIAMLLSAGTALGLIVSSLWLNQRGTNRQSSNPLIFQPPVATSVWLLVSAFILIPLAAFGLKPLLRPLFTLHSPPDRVLPAQQAVDIAFAEGIRLTGFDLPTSLVKPGDYLPVTLYWETDNAQLRVNLQPFAHLDRLDDGSTLADATNYTPGDVTTESNLPTFHWDTARYVRDGHDLTIPTDAPPLAYALRVGLIDPDQEGRLWPLADGRGDTAQLALVNVAPLSDPTPLANPLAARFEGNGDIIELTGFALDPPTTEGVTFRLAWRCSSQPQRDYTIFAQLLDLNHNLAAGFDGPPLAGAYPTSTWLPEQTILDPRHILVKALAPGDYRLVVGLYDPRTGQRLTTASGADFVELSHLTLEAP